MPLETTAAKQPLWVPVAAPAIWSVHFMLCYTTAALWCGRFAPPRTPDLRMLTAIFTAVAMAAIGVCFVYALRRRGDQLATAPHDDDTPENREQFVAFTTLLLAGMSMVAVIFEAIAIFIVNRCSA
jgi:hypothetical protein